MNIALFADIPNLFFVVGRKFPEKKLNYQRLYESIEQYGKIIRAFAYGVQLDDEATRFITCLKKIGFDTSYKKQRVTKSDDEEKKYRRTNWSVGIAMDVVRVIDRVDAVFLCSSDPDFAPLLHWVNDRGVQSVVFSAGISPELKVVASRYIEIDDSLLEEK